jgi:hypothetical protein
MLRTLVPLRRAVAAALVALSAASAAGAQTATLNFNGLTDPDGLGVRPVANCYMESGYTVTAVGVPCTGTAAATALAVGSAIDPTLFPGSPAIFLNDPTATMIEFTRVGGGLFSLSSIAFAPFLQAATTVTLMGIRPSAATVMLTLAGIPAGGLVPALSTFTPAGLTGLSALRVSSTNQFGEPYVLIDNVTFVGAAVSTVPEPATIALFATGLLGVGAFARRRRAAA